MSDLLKLLDEGFKFLESTEDALLQQFCDIWIRAYNNIRLKKEKVEDLTSPSELLEVCLEIEFKWVM